MADEDITSEIEEEVVEEKTEEVIGGFLYQNIFKVNYKAIVPSIVQYNVVKSMKYGDSFGMMMFLHDLRKKQRAADDIMRRKLMLEEAKHDAKGSHSHSSSISHKINHKYYEPTHS